LVYNYDFSFLVSYTLRNVSVSTFKYLSLKHNPECHQATFFFATADIAYIFYLYSQSAAK